MVGRIEDRMSDLICLLNEHGNVDSSSYRSLLHTLAVNVKVYKAMTGYLPFIPAKYKKEILEKFF